MVEVKRAVASVDSGELRSARICVIDGNFEWTRFLFAPLATQSPVLFLNPRDPTTARQAGWKLRDWGALQTRGDEAQERQLIFPSGWFSVYPAPFLWLLGRMAHSWLESNTATMKVAVLTYPQYVPVLQNLKGVRSIYYWSDDFFSYWPDKIEYLQRAEAAAVHRTDLTITASVAKCEELRAKFPDHAEKIHALIHGHHPSLNEETCTGDPSALPSDIRHLARPILGHWGNISRHLDMQLALQVAKALPTASLVFVGPVIENFEGEQAEAVRALREMGNVHFVGPRPYRRIAEYVRSFDVCLCLYRPDISFCQVINPSKVRDYLASGRPIVSTGISEVVRLWGSLVNIGTSAAEFIDGIRTALADSRQEARRGYARLHSYEKAAERLRELLLEHLSSAE